MGADLRASKFDPKRLRAEAARADLSIEEVSVLTGYAECTVRDWFYGKERPGWFAIDALAKVLETESAALLDFGPPVAPPFYHLSDDLLLLDAAADEVADIAEVLADATTIGQAERIYQRLVDLHAKLRGGAPL